MSEEEGDNPFSFYKFKKATVNVATDAGSKSAPPPPPSFSSPAPLPAFSSPSPVSTEPRNISKTALDDLSTDADNPFSIFSFLKDKEKPTQSPPSGPPAPPPILPPPAPPVVSVPPVSSSSSPATILPSVTAPVSSPISVSAPLPPVSPLSGPAQTVPSVPFQRLPASVPLPSTLNSSSASARSKSPSPLSAAPVLPTPQTSCIDELLQKLEESEAECARQRKRADKAEEALAKWKVKEMADMKALEDALVQIEETLSLEKKRAESAEAQVLMLQQQLAQSKSGADASAAVEIAEKRLQTSRAMRKHAARMMYQMSERAMSESIYLQNAAKAVQEYCLQLSQDSEDFEEIPR